MSEEASPGVLFVLSAPSGTGKSSLCRRLIEEVPGLAFSIRPRRSSTETGVAWSFIEVSARIAGGSASSVSAAPWALDAPPAGAHAAPAMAADDVPMNLRREIMALRG